MSETPESPSESTTVDTVRRSRLNQAAAWVGIVAGGLFIVAVIFLSGFFFGLPAGAHHSNSGDCCASMGAGKMMSAEHMMGPGQMGTGNMEPGAMMPDGMMGPRQMGPGMRPGAPMGPGNTPGSPPVSSTPRP
jgi:hypothetical protein